MEVNTNSALIQPSWVCINCGEKYRAKPPVKDHISTLHMGTCGVCKEHKVVTEPRDFGYLTPAWKSHANNN